MLSGRFRLATAPTLIVLFVAMTAATGALGASEGMLAHSVTAGAIIGIGTVIALELRGGRNAVRWLLLFSLIAFCVLTGGLIKEMAGLSGISTTGATMAAVGALVAMVMNTRLPFNVQVSASTTAAMTRDAAFEALRYKVTNRFWKPHARLVTPITGHDDQLRQHTTDPSMLDDPELKLQLVEFAPCTHFTVEILHDSAGHGTGERETLRFEDDPEGVRVTTILSHERPKFFTVLNIFATRPEKRQAEHILDALEGRTVIG